MGDNPDISVLLANYNGEKYLRESIVSILNQTIDSIELIIIDDGSIDNSLNIIREFMVKDSRIVFIRNTENLGTSIALNKGLDISRGRLITRQDCDDISEPSRLEVQARFLEDNPQCMAISTPALLIQADGSPIKTDFTKSSEEIKNSLLDKMCLCGPTVMIRRDAFEKIGMYFSEDLSYTEDYDLSLRISEVGEIGNLTRPLYRYRQHSESVSNAKRFQQLYNKAIAVERALTRRFAAHPPTKDLNLLARDYLRASVVAYLHAENHHNARNCIIKAVRFSPNILLDKSLISDILEHYAPRNDPQAAIEFLDYFNEILPYNPDLRKVKNKLLARYHIEAAFSLLPDHNHKNFEQHLWRGIESDPSCLANRGILSIIIKLGLKRLGLPINLKGKSI